MNEKEAIQTIGTFCAQRDINELTQNELKNKYGIEQVDLLVLVGGSIPEGMNVFMQALPLAKHTMLVGGRGHTTQAFQDALGIEGELSEAEIFDKVLKDKFGYTADYLETKSTNCGLNAQYMMELLTQQHVEVSNMIVIHDATMQRRMDATLRKYTPDIQVINYASYTTYDPTLWGMWDEEHYRTLLMGEIIRLHDTKTGYGPKGTDFIAHVDVPQDVLEAYEYLKEFYPEGTRKAK